MNTIKINNQVIKVNTEEERQQVINNDFIRSLKIQYQQNLKIIQQLQKENEDIQQKIKENE